MSQIKPTSEPAETAGLVLPLNDIAHLFKAPSVDPLAGGPLAGCGISGVEYLLNQLHLDKARQRAHTLTLSLPAEKVATASAEQITQALHRYAGWQIAREQRDMRNTYRYGWKTAGFGMVMLTVCLALSSLFASDLTQWMRPFVRTLFVYGFEIIGWVVLWRPFEVLVYSPVAIRARLAALQTLAAVEVVIRAEPMPAAGKDSPGAVSETSPRRSP